MKTVESIIEGQRALNRHKVHDALIRIPGDAAVFAREDIAAIQNDARTWRTMDSAPKGEWVMTMTRNGLGRAFLSLKPDSEWRDEKQDIAYPSFWFPFPVFPANEV